MSNKRGLAVEAGVADCEGGVQKGSRGVYGDRQSNFCGSGEKKQGKYVRANLPSIWASLAFSALAVANQALKAAFSPPFSAPM